VAKPHIFVTVWKRAGCPAGGDTIGDTIQMGGIQPPVLVKRYAGRRLYRPAASAYLTREDLISMAKNGEEFVVIDASTQEDVTRSYRPIIVEH
jgi:polyhydroxyalkanoate synthesis regulator protein